jgi:hypothetical protein
MTSDQLRNGPFGHSAWGVVVALILAIVLALAYVEGPRSATGAAFALGALALLGRQLQARRIRGAGSRR